MVNYKFEKNKWYYVELLEKYQHLFQYSSETKDTILLGKTHWDLCYETSKHSKGTNFNKSALTFVKELTDHQAKQLQEGVKFKDLKFDKIYELWA
jgi:hypothetical protein